MQPGLWYTLAGDCGETGIRTLGAFASTTVFETAPFNRSGISPFGNANICDLKHFFFLFFTST